MSLNNDEMCLLIKSPADMLGGDFSDNFTMPNAMRYHCPHSNN